MTMLTMTKNIMKITDKSQPAIQNEQPSVLSLFKNNLKAQQQFVSEDKEIKEFGEIKETRKTEEMEDMRETQESEESEV
ncbi:hypothetical protein Glove_256g198 [Diversispora epigaea]|uniref:Uncharacterized protein n=1 Tax=Diversispora epigaea TaxID=1348612 RepID=A0A397I9R9_9GLOM|nr:hypothetical protein Glove_256g198 [Diversispora epigaea]